MCFFIKGALFHLRTTHSQKASFQIECPSLLGLIKVDDFCRDVTKDDSLGESILMLCSKYIPLYEKAWNKTKTTPIKTTSRDNINKFELVHIWKACFCPIFCSKDNFLFLYKELFEFTFVWHFFFVFDWIFCVSLWKLISHWKHIQYI